MGMEIRPGDKILVVLPSDVEGELSDPDKMMALFKGWWPDTMTMVITAPGVQPDVIAVYRDEK